MSGTSANKDFENFVLRRDYSMQSYGVNKWRTYAKDDDLFYSEKETTNESDLKPFSTLTWAYNVEKRYYIYKKGKVDKPNGYTYVGIVFTSGSSEFFVEAYGINSLKGIEANLSGTSAKKDFENFVLKRNYSMVGSGVNQWNVNTNDNNMFYSLNETTNVLDLKPFSSLSWPYYDNKRYYFYRKE